MNHTFKSTSDYLEALAKNPRLAVVSVAMAAESLERTRAGVLLMLKSERLNGITIDGSLYVSAESIIEQRQKHHHQET
jgi:hypothetical protein